MLMTHLYGCGRAHLRKTLEVNLTGNTDIPEVASSGWLSGYTDFHRYQFMTQDHKVYLIPEGLPLFTEYACEIWQPCGINQFTRSYPEVS
ncbi:hypothetical protein AHIS2_p060 [Acaryochloris phage A-HIS2]|nr:hypothetical protein AHIS2_p060 [Acaryochloris phage A-HIS2]